MIVGVFMAVFCVLSCVLVCLLYSMSRPMFHPLLCNPFVRVDTGKTWSWSGCILWGCICVWYFRLWALDFALWALGLCVLGFACHVREGERFALLFMRRKIGEREGKEEGWRG